MATASKSRLARSNIAVRPVQATTRERHETAKSPREFQGPTPTPVPCGDREHGAAETRHWKESNRHLHANGSTSVSLCASRGGGGLTCPLLGAKTVAVACPRWRGLAQSCLARCLCQNRGGCAEKETRRARAWPQQARADHSPSASDTMLCIEHPLVSARSRTSCQHVPRSLPACAPPRQAVEAASLRPCQAEAPDSIRMASAARGVHRAGATLAPSSGPGPRPPLLPGAPQRGGGLIGSALRTAGL